jgi:hypothetical protein
LEKSGVLPFPGSFASQPAFFIDALRAWDSAPGIFARQKKRLSETLKRLGAFSNGKRSKNQHFS